MENEEPCMQASFQHHYDEGAAGDETHKYSNKIFANTTAKSWAQPVSPFLHHTHYTIRVEPLLSVISNIQRVMMR
jgi:hypothetical protein